jgi:hypothetical protein
MPAVGISGRMIKVGRSFRTQSYPPGFARGWRENHCSALTPNRKIPANLAIFRAAWGTDIPSRFDKD